MARMLAALRPSLPLSTTSLRNFFPKELTQKLTHARRVFLQFKHRVPERSIALTGVLNLLDEMEKFHGGPFEQLVEWDEEIKSKLQEMIGEFKERQRDSFSFGLDKDLHHRLRMAAEFTGVPLRQIVATGIASILAELETLYGRPFSDSLNREARHQALSTEAAPSTKEKPMTVDGAQRPNYRDICGITMGPRPARLRLRCHRGNRRASASQGAMGRAQPPDLHHSGGWGVGGTARQPRGLVGGFDRAAKVPVN